MAWYNLSIKLRKGNEMDIFSEINKLPYYLYVFDDRAMSLGGGSHPPGEMPFDRIYDLWRDTELLYRKNNLSDEEKILYAKNVQKMGNWSMREKLSRSELKEKIDSLNDKERGDIVWQIEMYKLGREFYRDYVHRK